jgi:hypothetical protein
MRGVHENLALLEAELRDGAFKGRRFFGWASSTWSWAAAPTGRPAVFEEVIGVRLVEADAFPLYHAWLRDFETLDMVHKTIHSMDRLLEYGRGMHHMLLGFAGASGAGAASPAKPPACGHARARLTSPWTSYHRACTVSATSCVGDQVVQCSLFVQCDTHASQAAWSALVVLAAQLSGTVCLGVEFMLFPLFCC